MAVPKFSSLYDHHDGPKLNEFSPSATKQEFLEESDINHIVNQYETTHMPLAEGTRQPLYGDFSDPELANYHDAQNVVIGARQLFDSLPARTRERFANDPANLILFVQDPANIAEAKELGLLRPDYKSPSAPPAPPTPPNNEANKP